MSQGVPVLVDPVIMENDEDVDDLGFDIKMGRDEISVIKNKKKSKARQQTSKMQMMTQQ